MKRFIPLVLFLLVQPLLAEKPPIDAPAIPVGLGYNIHFTAARPGEMEMIAESGATIIRMDFGWGGTEREKGVYDFSAFDRLTADLEKHGMRPLYILDYSNRHYDEGLSPYSEEGRKAFAKWAAAAAVHFKGRKILWEMYNEPNIGFWKPKPNTDDYIKLALEVGKAIREVAPDELYIGPATSQIDMPFLEDCFKAGLLEYWDAVSVHPYRQKGPETVVAEYAKLRWLIDKYAPKDKKIPILSAEWGYSSAWEHYDDEIQGKMLPRQWMINLACEVPVSIWYDWHDDGTDPKEPEHHFGTTNHAYKKDQKTIYDPKPSYIAAKTFNETFKGFRYNKRIWTGSDDEFVFLFSNDKEVKLAAWTISKEPKTLAIPCPAGKFELVSYLGEKLPNMKSDEKGLALAVYDGPVYLTPEKSDGFWNEVAQLPVFPINVYGNHVVLTKPGESPKLAATRDYTFPPFAKKEKEFLKKTVQGIEIVQKMELSPDEPMSIGLPTLQKEEIRFVINNPSAQPFEGAFLLEDVQGLDIVSKSTKLSLKKGDRESVIRFPLQSPPSGEYRFALKVQTDKGVFPVLPLQTYRMLDDFSKYNTESLEKNWQIVPDGDAKVKSEQKIEMNSDGMVKITYRFDDGWKFIRLVPKNNELRKIDEKAKKLAVRIEGDGSDCSVNIRFTDKTSQTFQVHGGRLTEKKSYYFEFPLDDPNVGHWGGANDGVIHGPIRFDSILIDGKLKSIGPNNVSISSMVLIFE